MTGILTATLLAQAAMGQPKANLDCPRMPGSANNCTPLVACLLESETVFSGRAFGWSEGRLAGDTSAGYFCEGSWTANGPIGTGKAELSCGNGLTGFALFTYQHAQSGTTTGFGRMSDGQTLRVWSGHNIKQFIRGTAGDLDAKLLCGVKEIPIG